MVKNTQEAADFEAKEGDKGHIEHEQDTDNMGIEMSESKSGRTLLWEEELAVRKAVEHGWSGNVFGSALVNGYSAMLIFALYLLSVESLLSIGLSVGMTVCEYK
jgi:hypothetical protein